MPSSGCFSNESNRQGPAEDRSEKGFFPFQPFPGRPVESRAAFSFRTFPNKIGHLCLNVHRTGWDLRFPVSLLVPLLEFQPSFNIAKGSAGAESLLARIAYSAERS